MQVYKEDNMVIISIYIMQPILPLFIPPSFLSFPPMLVPVLLTVIDTKLGIDTSDLGLRLH